VDRLQKILARAGVASRRRAEELITSGRVRVNGRIVTELGTKADLAKDRIEVDGTRLVAEQYVYYIYHKPRGVVSTLSDPEGRPSLKDTLARHPEIDARVFPVGRLDFATSGALLLTNDGDFMNGLLHPKTDVPKTYVLKVKGKMTEADLEHWRRGIELEDGRTKPAQVKFDRHEPGGVGGRTDSAEARRTDASEPRGSGADKTWFYVTLTEGRNQQIRRMGEATGFMVMRLSRISFAGITTEGLAPGALRPLTRDELSDLRKRYGVPKKLPHGVIAAPPPRAPHGRVRQSRNADVNSSREGREQRTRGGGHETRRGMHRSESTYSQDRTEGPRYGGGSPGRRSHDVKEDWGGGSGRGRSFSGGGNTNARDDVSGGRMGRTRTTGTAGGIGARNDADRVKSRRGNRG
jgi:23S rRNA pseudouridine2605 synthase